MRHGIATQHPGRRRIAAVGWVERSETHHRSRSSTGFAALYPSYVPQLPFVRRVVRLIDGELVHRGLPEMLGQPRRLQIDLAFCNLVRQRAIQFDQRAVRAEQLLQPRGFRSITPLLQRQLPRHEIERVDADAKLEGVVALDLTGVISLRRKSATALISSVGVGSSCILFLLSGPAAAADRFPSPTNAGRSWRAPSNDPGRCESAASCRST